MATDAQSIPPIPRGFAYALRVRVIGDEPAFPAGCALKAEVRASIGSKDAAAGTLTTGAGTLIRIDDDTVELRLDAAITGRLGAGSAALDFVRTDVTPDVWLGVQLVLPVVQPVTLPDADA